MENERNDSSLATADHAIHTRIDVLAGLDIEAEIASIVRLGAQSPTRHAFRTEALRRLQNLVGFDSAVFCSRAPERPASVNASPAGTASLMAHFDVYVEDLRPIERAARASGGVAVDVQVLTTRQRDRLRFYRDIARPQGIHSMLAAYLSTGAREAGVMYCARTSRPRFDDRACRIMRALVPALALGDAIHPDTRDDNVQFEAEPVDPTRLTRRERELIDYAVLGLRNADIATALSVSAHTVRNQLSALYAKIGVANRTELTHFAMRTGLARK